jgi:hypothetical protein
LRHIYGADSSFRICWFDLAEQGGELLGGDFMKNHEIWFKFPAKRTELAQYFGIRPTVPQVEWRVRALVCCICIIVVFLL